jgi:hypothetical protein
MKKLKALQAAKAIGKASSPKKPSKPKGATPPKGSGLRAAKTTPPKGSHATGAVDTRDEHAELYRRLARVGTGGKGAMVIALAMCCRAVYGAHACCARTSRFCSTAECCSTGRHVATWQVIALTWDNPPPDQPLCLAVLAPCKGQINPRRAATHSTALQHGAVRHVWMALSPVPCG